MSVQNVILFVSSNSRVCAEPVQFVRQSGLPVVIVRLDTDTDRQNAIQGKYFQIHSVPTLLVIHGDGNIQLFQGREKIMEWLQQTFSQMRRNEKKQNKPDSVEEPAEDSDEEYEEKQKKRKPPKKKSKKKKRKPVKFVEDSDEDSDEDEESISKCAKEQKDDIHKLEKIFDQSEEGSRSCTPLKAIWWYVHPRMPHGICALYSDSPKVKRDFEPEDFYWLTDSYLYGWLIQNGCDRGRVWSLVDWWRDENRVMINELKAKAQISASQ